LKRGGRHRADLKCIVADHKLVEQHNPAAVIIDPLTSLMVGNINQNAFNADAADRFF